MCVCIKQMRLQWGNGYITTVQKRSPILIRVEALRMIESSRWHLSLACCADCARAKSCACTIVSIVPRLYRATDLPVRYATAVSNGTPITARSNGSSCSTRHCTWGRCAKVWMPLNVYPAFQRDTVSMSAPSAFSDGWLWPSPMAGQIAARIAWMSMAW